MSHFIGRETTAQPKADNLKDTGLSELEELREFAYYPQNLRYLDQDLLHMLCLTIYTPLVSMMDDNEKNNENKKGDKKGGKPQQATTVPEGLAEGWDHKLAAIDTLLHIIFHMPASIKLFKSHKGLRVIDFLTAVLSDGKLKDESAIARILAIFHHISVSEYARILCRTNIIKVLVARAAGGRIGDEDNYVDCVPCPWVIMIICNCINALTKEANSYTNVPRSDYRAYSEAKKKLQSVKAAQIKIVHALVNADAASNMDTKDEEEDDGEEGLKRRKKLILSMT
jgi:hypothetical protein